MALHGDAAADRGQARLRKTVDQERRAFRRGAPTKHRCWSLLEKFARDPRVLDVLGRDCARCRILLYSDAAWERVREVAQVLVLAAAELDGVFREQGAVDFPAVSMAALRALGSGGCADGFEPAARLPACSTFSSTNSKIHPARSWNWCGC